MNKVETEESDFKQTAIERHPIAESINQFIHRVRDTKLAIRVHMEAANNFKSKQLEEIKSSLEQVKGNLENKDQSVVEHSKKNLFSVLRRLDRLVSSNVPQTILTGLFLKLFADFDAFIGHLLRGLYSRKPAMFKSERSVEFSSILAADSIDALKQQVMNDDIEALRRKSYVEQFETLSKRFDVVLTKFDAWSDFIECSQRRNLFTHCDGLVNDQYCSVCEAAGINKTLLPKKGTTLELELSYVLNACELHLEVGFKLGQTLWRKTLPQEISDAESNLMDMLYNTLENGNWRRAKMIGEFGLSQKIYSCDKNRKIMLINYVQALKRDGSPEKALDKLSEVDWSSSAKEFILAEIVLRDDYDGAAKLMREIGANDAALPAQNYHRWPLFLEFRAKEQFAQAYKDVFGHQYIEKLEGLAAQASETTAKEAERHSAEIEASSLDQVKINESVQVANNGMQAPNLPNNTETKSS